MSKKYFEAMAKRIRAVSASRSPNDSDPTATDAFIRGMYDLAVWLGRENNPRFDVERFRKACGLDENE